MKKEYIVQTKSKVFGLFNFPVIVNTDLVYTVQDEISNGTYGNGSQYFLFTIYEIIPSPYKWFCKFDKYEKLTKKFRGDGTNLSKLDSGIKSRIELDFKIKIKE